jgi:hypothetical protein
MSVKFKDQNEYGVPFDFPWQIKLTESSSSSRALFPEAFNP